MLEVSLPKLLFENNYRCLAALTKQSKMTNILLQRLPHIPNLDIAEGILIRLGYVLQPPGRGYGQ